MALTNEIIQDLIMENLNLSIGQEITIKELWDHLCHTDYRKNAIKFMEVTASRFPETISLDDTLISKVLTSASPLTLSGQEILQTKFKVTKAHLEQAEESNLIEDKGRYVLQVFGQSYRAQTNTWEVKSTQMFSILLD